MINPPLSDGEIDSLRRYAETEETTGLLTAAVEELLALRAELARLRSAGESLLADAVHGKEVGHGGPNARNDDLGGSPGLHSGEDFLDRM